MTGFKDAQNAMRSEYLVPVITPEQHVAAHALMVRLHAEDLIPVLGIFDGGKPPQED